MYGRGQQVSTPYQNVELAVEGGPDSLHEPLPVGAHGEVAGGDGDVQALLGPPPAARLQICRAARARVHPHTEASQLLHDGVTDPLATAGDERRRARQAPPLTPAIPAGGRHGPLPP